MKKLSVHKLHHFNEMRGSYRSSRDSFGLRRCEGGGRGTSCIVSPATTIDVFNYYRDLGYMGLHKAMMRSLAEIECIISYLRDHDDKIREGQDTCLRQQWHLLKIPSKGVFVLALLFNSTHPNIVSAQNIGSSGSTWGGSWEFQSPSGLSVDIQRADTIAKADGGYYTSFGPAQSVVNSTTINDNRSNYVESLSSDGGTSTVEFKVGDDIGTMSNVTGAINTGSTTISVDGSSNQISAINSSDSQGCLDGSINETMLNNRYLDPASSASVLNSVAGYTAPTHITTTNSTGGTQSGCVARH